MVIGNNLGKEMFKGVVFGKRGQGRQKNLLDRRHNIIDRDENHKGDKTGGNQERMAGARTTSHGRELSATDAAN